MRYLSFYNQFVDIENPKKDGFTECFCPFHDDRTKKSAGVNLSSGVFHCFACELVLSPSKFIQRVDPDTGPALAALIINDYRLKNKIIEHEENATYTVPWRSPKFEELAERCTETDIETIQFVREYAEEHGITIDTLREAGIGYLSAGYTNWKRDSMVFVYRLGGRVVGLRYRDEQGNKSYEPGSHGTLWGTELLTLDDQVCIITEGESDALRARQELRNLGLKVLSTPGVMFRKEWTRELDGLSRVILIPQADEASSKLVEASTRALGDRLKVFTLPWERGQVGKDLCHWFIYNDTEKFQKQIGGLAAERIHSRVMSYKDFSEYAHTAGRSLPVIQQLFSRGELAILGGPPKNMKTWLAINLLRTVFTSDETFCDLPGLYGANDPDERVLLIEEEGNAEKLLERCDLILKDIDVNDRLFFGHRLGLKMDTEEGFQKTLHAVERYSITGLIMDPYQRMTTGDEDSATETAPFWNNVHRLLAIYPRMWGLVIHHFSKSATIMDLWNALRGSIRGAGEVDLGIFVEKRPRSEGIGIRARFDGRNIEPMETPDGKDIFKFFFKPETGLFSFDSTTVSIDKHIALLEELRVRKEWSIDEAARHFGNNRKTILRWVEKLGKRVSITPVAPGRVATLVFDPTVEVLENA